MLKLVIKIVTFYLKILLPAVSVVRQIVRSIESCQQNTLLMIGTIINKPTALNDVENAKNLE